MKKLFTLMAAALVAAGASAQTVQESKTFDNFYVGVNGGVATKTTGYAWLKGLDPNFGVRVGRWFTPVFGLAAESNAYFSNKPANSFGTTVRAMNTSLLATVNLSNWFGGYKGEPRTFEVIPVYGLGWYHSFGNSGVANRTWDATSVTKANPDDVAATYYAKRNALTSKVGIDFAFNLGEAKAWQVYVEPSITWALNGFDGEQKVAYNINNSYVQLNAGVVYKFNTSNGTHNFKIVKPYDQAEIDQLNSTINDLRDELAKKPKEVVKEVVKEAPAPQEVKVENLVFVTFAQGKSALTKEAKKALDGVKSGKHVQIVGTASPEGSKEINDKLSQARADEVAKYLKNNGVVVDEATGKGVQGNTSNRLAVVYVK